MSILIRYTNVIIYLPLSLSPSLSSIISIISLKI